MSMFAPTSPTCGVRALVVSISADRVETCRARALNATVLPSAPSVGSRGSSRTGSGCRTAPGVRALAERDPHAHRAGQPAGRAAQHAAGGLRDRQRARRRRAAVKPVGWSTSALVGDRGLDEPGWRRCRGRWRRRRTGVVGGSAPTRPTIAANASLVSVPSVVARRARACTSRRVERRVRVVDRPCRRRRPGAAAARAGALERVAERPHAVGVGVRDGPDRAEPDVAARVAAPTRRRPGAASAAGSCRAARRARRSPAGRSARRSRSSARPSAALTRRDDRQRRGERLGALRCACAGCAAAARGERAVAGVARPRRVDRVGEHRLDRRREHASCRRTRRSTPRSRRCCAARRCRRGSRSASREKPGPMPVASTAGPDTRDEHPRDRRSAGVAVDRRRRSRRRTSEIVGAAHHRVAGALHAGADLRQRHDRVAGEGRRGRSERGRERWRRAGRALTAHRSAARCSARQRRVAVTRSFT